MGQDQSEEQPTPKAEVSAEQIAERAYEIFVNRGCQHGHDQEDWIQAEQELQLGNR